MDVLLDAAGWCGAAALLAAYALSSLGRLRPGPGLQLLNAAGAGALAASCAAKGAFPAAALNAAWLLVAVVSLGRSGRGGQPDQGGPEDGSAQATGPQAARQGTPCSPRDVLL